MSFSQPLHSDIFVRTVNLTAALAPSSFSLALPPALLCLLSNGCRRRWHRSIHRHPLQRLLRILIPLLWGLLVPLLRLLPLRLWSLPLPNPLPFFLGYILVFLFFQLSALVFFFVCVDFRPPPTLSFVGLVPCRSCPLSVPSRFFHLLSLVFVFCIVIAFPPVIRVG
jgi:hypothetical protein